ncbi:MAG: hypothetical protein CL878_11975 [Dehalococcoidia bacterium]|nr:hypothetical protein [Dehalococcoidia bacterium]
MRVLVVGAGALGTVYAALLAQAGTQVTVLVKPSHVEALRARDNHLRVEGLVSVDAPVTVVTTGAEAGTVDWLLLLVKTKDTATALAAATGCRPRAVLSLQNGLAKNAWLAKAFGTGSVVGGVAMVAATHLAAGHARLNVNANTWLGEPGGGASARVAALAARLNAAGLPTTAVEDITAVEWWKVCGVLTTSLTTALARRDNAAVLSHPLLGEIYVDLAREVVAVARAEGVAVADPPGTASPMVAWADGPRAEALAGLRQRGEQLQAAGQRPLASMAQDVLAERRTEVEDVAGEVVRRAAARDVPVPVLATCYRLARGLEDGFPDR